MLLRRERRRIFFYFSSPSHLSLLPGMDAIKIGGRGAPTKCTFAEEIRGERGGGVAGLEFTLHPPPPIPLHAYKFHMLEMRANILQFPNVKLWAKKLDLLVKKVSWAWGGKEHG